MSTPTGEWAWCFSHGRLHRFASGEEPWCTATWAWLRGATENEALVDKSITYGDAQFLHHLPAEQQLQLIQNRP